MIAGLTTKARAASFPLDQLLDARRRGALLCLICGSDETQAGRLQCIDCLCGTGAMLADPEDLIVMNMGPGQMSAIIKAHGLGDGTMFGHDLWVESFDADVEPLWKESIWRKGGGCIINGAFGGRIILTPRRAKAKRFDDAAAALTAWNTASTTRPRRPDGRPNKPMTALTVEVETL